MGETASPEPGAVASGDSGPTRRRLLATAAGAAGGLTAVGLAAPETAFAAAPTDWFNVKVNYGAKGNGSTDDTAAIQKATAASAVSGGVVYFPPGNYKLTGPLTYYPNTRWLGANRGASIISLTQELYTSGVGPAHFISPYKNQSFLQGQEWSIEHLSIFGPGYYKLGQATTRTTGVVLNSQARMSCCIVQGFFGGIEIQSDHQSIDNSKSSNNYYNVDFPDSMSNYGFSNQAFYKLDLTGCLLASIHIGGAGTMDMSTAIGVHLGFGPVGIFKTDNQDGWDAAGNPTYNGTPSTKSGITGSELLGVWCEQIGNCCFLDISTGKTTGSLQLTKWRSVGHSWGNSYTTTTAPLDNPTYQQEWAVVLNGTYGTEIDGGEAPFIPGSAGVVNLDDGPLTMVFANVPDPKLVGSGSTWGITGTGSITVVITGDGNDVTGTGYVWSSTETIDVGDIVELVPASWGQVRRAMGTNPILGVALTPGSAGGAIAVQVEGAVSVNCIGNGQILSGHALSLSNTTPYLADFAANNPGARPLGFSVNNGASPTTSIDGVQLRL